MIFGYCHQFSLTSTEQAFRDVTCKPCSLHNDTPDHGCNVPSVVKSGKPWGRLAKLAVNVKYALEQLVSCLSYIASCTKVCRFASLVGCKQANRSTSCDKPLSSPGSHQSCQYAIYGLDLSMPSLPAVGSCSEVCCSFARCLSLLHQLVASCNEVCCSFASYYKAWPTVLRFIAR